MNFYITLYVTEAFYAKQNLRHYNHRLTVSRLISEGKQALEIFTSCKYTVFLNIPVLFPFFGVSRGNNEETTGMLVKVLKINTNLQTSNTMTLHSKIIVLMNHYIAGRKIMYSL